MENEEFRDMHFPLAGTDLSQPFDRQPIRPLSGGVYSRSTAFGVNVRGYEPSTDRARGGARPGLVRLIDATVSGLSGFPVQLLAPVVTVSGDALLAGSIPTSPPVIYGGAEPGNPGEPDPRNPDRTVREGGNGTTPNRNIPYDPGTSPPAGNRRVLTVSFTNQPNDGTGNQFLGPDTTPLDPAGGDGGPSMQVNVVILSEQGRCGNVPGNKAASVGTPDLITTEVSGSNIKLPAQWSDPNQASNPPGYFTGKTDPNQGTTGGSFGLNQINVELVSSNSAINSTRSSWEALKASFSGDLRVLVLDRVGSLSVDLDACSNAPTPFSPPLGSVARPETNAAQVISLVFGTAADVVDYVRVDYGDADPGDPAFTAADAQVSAQIAAWQAAHPA